MNSHEGPQRDFKQESIDAVREGRALPLPEFAVQEGGEMIDVLTAEIRNLDPEQLEQLAAALKKVDESETLYAGVGTVESGLSLLDQTGKFVLVVPFFLGTLLTGGNFGAGAIVAGFSGLMMSGIAGDKVPDKKQKAVIRERLKMLKDVVERAQETQHES